jgi:polar amino acid transport system substrate-binding protein
MEVMAMKLRSALAQVTPALALILMTAALLLMPAAQATAQEEGTGVHELVVGTKEAPPFAMKDPEGKWSGISIDLWRRVADKLKLQYRFVEMPSVPALLDGVTKGDLDVAVAAITVTQQRAQQVDFSTPYFNAGTGVAVPMERFASWIPVIRSLTSYGFVQALTALLGLAVLCGALIWFFEHRANEGFSGGLARGIGTGVWWSANTMAQRAGGADPLTVPGRIVATTWMIASVIAIAVFTAGITSALTTKRLRGAVNTVTDLSSVNVATVQGTATEEALSQMRIKYKTVASPKDGFQSLREGKIDALAYDRPILAWMIRQDGQSGVELTEVTFQPQSYAIALQNESTLRKRINVALLEAEQSDWWKSMLFRYLGQTTN